MYPFHRANTSRPASCGRARSPSALPQFGGACLPVCGPTSSASRRNFDKADRPAVAALGKRASRTHQSSGSFSVSRVRFLFLGFGYRFSQVRFAVPRVRFSPQTVKISDTHFLQLHLPQTLPTISFGDFLGFVSSLLYLYGAPSPGNHPPQSSHTSPSRRSAPVSP